MLLNYKIIGKGEPILLLHGMASSIRYWESLAPELAKKNTIIMVDLLGFGNSPKPRGAAYDTDAHVNSIAETLDSIGIKQPVILVGHSMGALIALRLAASYPKKVGKLVLIGLFYFHSPEEAKRVITKSSWIRKLIYYGRTSKTICTIWCKLLRPISSKVAPIYLKQLPKHVAEDSVLHSWESYHKSLSGVVENQSVVDDLAKLSIPITLLYGDQEPSEVLDNAKELILSNSAKLIVLPGSHNIPLDIPERVKDIILN